MGTTVSENPDVNEMRVIHRVFRRELTAPPGLVRRVPDGDIARAEVVAGHARFMLNVLHVHHLPLAEEHVTVEEWGRLGEHGRGSLSRDEMPIMFGAILEEADPSEREQMMANVPPPVRLILRAVGARKYRRYISGVRSG